MGLVVNAMENDCQGSAKKWEFNRPIHALELCLKVVFDCYIYALNFSSVLFAESLSMFPDEKI